MAQENVTGCLGNLVLSSDQDLKLLVAREGGIECPKNYWEAAPSVCNLEDAVGLLSGRISSFGTISLPSSFLDGLCNGVTCIALFWLDGCPDGFLLFVCFIWASS
ncbi:hypothetical protein NE237_019172 [Protea cynaroides]|uniref:Uncharacterized protein n=1 Tax=Protea cynaroides TaxID=273540 RepID=A0A9Q0KB83_9MAGN|nr:hypothetical protein NE237_019172 [Protea cynaroides]